MAPNAVATTVLDVAMWRNLEELPPVLNVVHPQPVEYDVPLNGIVNTIRDILGTNLSIVPYDQWLTTLKAQTEKATLDTLTSITAIKLLGFLRRNAAGGLPNKFSLDTAQSVGASLRLGELKQLEGDDAKLWVKYWNRVGHFDSN
ncbi:hypothetical protein H0H87_005362 [Tephrocybe sp. NHM501043]|nr:hypothetical protein H0H87_005362 [Tephrocybe sp. NHM501043]